MNVRDLMRELKSLDPDLRVVVARRGGFDDIEHLLSRVLILDVNDMRDEGPHGLVGNVFDEFGTEDHARERAVLLLCDALVSEVPDGV